jgi:amidase
MIEKTLQELIFELRNHTTNSEQLVKTYLSQIERYDGILNAVAELNEEALKTARALDKEAAEKGFRSLLHGIPLLIKDNINTSDSMHTTANSEALSDLITPYEATIVTKLRDAGAIILGKANLSEFAYFMSFDKMPSGYGSRNGQVVSPYHSSIDPLGSSTGSAVAVAANMIPVAIGTETNGSLMAPAYQNSIVSIKPTFGRVSRYGIIPISVYQDTAGPMAKTVADCAILLDIIQGGDPLDPMTQDEPANALSLSDAFKLDVSGRKVGIVTLSGYQYDEEELAILNDAKEHLIKLGIEIEEIAFESHSMPNTKSMLYEFKNGLNNYLESVKGYTKMTSLADIIAYNTAHSEKCLRYGQSILEAAEKTSGDLNDPEYLKIREALLVEANRFETLMKERNLDALISTIWTSYAPIAGNPSICVPAKALVDLKPRSLIFVGKKWDDARLISIAHAYEQATRYRIPPKLD